MSHRILIIRTSALGDIIHGLPVAAALRDAFPDAHLGWLVEDRGAPLIYRNPILDRVHILRRDVVKKDLLRNPWITLRGPIRTLLSELRSEGYEISIDLQGLTKSAVWGKLADARMRIGFRGEDSRELSRWFYNEAIRPPDSAVHVVEKNLSLLQPLGLGSIEPRFPLRLDEEILERGREIWGLSQASGSTGPRRVVLNVGAGWPTKAWPAEWFGELGARLVKEKQARVAIAWGPGEEAAAEKALNRAESAGLRATQIGRGEVRGQPGMYLLPPTTFVESGGIIAGSDLYVGGDTGPTHLAAALGIPVVSPFGASDVLRNGPLGPKVESIQLDHPECIPCWSTECRWSEPLACLRGIPVNRIYSACENFLT